MKSDKNHPADKVERWSIERLIPYARNARTHSPEQVAQIAASIREWGWTTPILVDTEGGIIAGHGRLMAAQRLSMTQVPVMVADGWTDAQKRAYVLADNKLTLNAGWDNELLALELSELQGLDFDLDLTGFSPDEIAALQPIQLTEGLTDEDAVPDAPVNPVTVPGDVWILGKHRVMCGDCRNNDIQKLVSGAKINLAFTSPPYAEQREYDSKSGFKPIPPDEYVEWFSDVASTVQSILAPDGSWFVNIKPSAEGLDTSLYVMDLVIAHVRQWGWHFATEFCWERSGIPKGVTRRFKNQFEPIYQFVTADWKMRPDAVRHESKSVPKPRGKGAGNTSWGESSGGGLESIHMSGKQGEVGFKWFGDDVGEGMAYPGNRLPTFAASHTAAGHGAAFPVGLPEFFMMAYTDAGDSVFDPFMGSGSTLIAAEKSGRVAYGTEISPIYCDVIVKRWQDFTGLKAIHAETGQPFAEVANA